MTNPTPSAPAPVVLFAYNRPWHLQQTVRALQQNEGAAQSDLIVFSDGPKTEADRPDVEAVRRYLATLTGFKSVLVHEHAVNQGLAKSIIEGVTRIVNQYGRIIVLEDDVVSSPAFLPYCNAALDLYADETRVGMVHAQIYDIPGMPDLFFTYKIGCLGWATWKRAWDEVSFDGPALLAAIRQNNLGRKFDINGSYPYQKLLINQIRGKNNSWAVRVGASFLLKNMLTLNVGHSLTTHIGYDTGTHCQGDARPSPLDGVITDRPVPCVRIPVVENPEANRKLEHFLRRRKLIRLAQLLQSSWFSARHAARNAAAALNRALGWRKAVKRHCVPPRSPDSHATAPVSRVFGLDRGTPIDRLYIEAFLDENRAAITGSVMEIAENTYTRRFGSCVTRSEVLHVARGNPDTTLVGDLTRRETLPENLFDCVICTQTLLVIYDFHAAIAGLHTLLKEGGVALVTVAGICQISRYDMDRWGDYWRFTPLAMEKAFGAVFGEGHVTVKGWGNVLAAKAYLDGLAAEELERADLMQIDRDYPIVITVVARK